MPDLLSDVIDAASTTRAWPPRWRPSSATDCRGFLSSRDSAARIGLERSGGFMRASGFARQPLGRMTNVSLEPGDAGSLADVVAATDRGVRMETAVPRGRDRCQTGRNRPSGLGEAPEGR